MSIRQRKLTKHYGLLENSSPRNYKFLKTSPDKKYLYLTFGLSYKQIDTHTHIMTDYAHTRGSGRFRYSTRIEITPDSKYLFIGGFRGQYGRLRQYDSENHAELKTHELNEGVTSLLATKDSKYLFIGCVRGRLYQLCVSTQTMLRDYGNIGSLAVNGMS